MALWNASCGECQGWLLAFGQVSKKRGSPAVPVPDSMIEQDREVVPD
jgi:hypothetical protein